ncbi:MAG: glutamate--tRNA ligase [Nitrospirae bacterium]|nr:MAG: glutamate--tRNA ligase [Nitrospirota bacterium]
MADVRVRFAPSPTGYLHIGGVRTALFNWLFARHAQGKFILRIEDTDQDRSTEEAIQAILDGMRWVGLDWDEGPFRQTDRMDLYRQQAIRLLEQRQAYWCVCRAEELEARRKDAMAKGLQPGYDGRCRERGITNQNGDAALRFKASREGQTVVEDLIKGRVVFENNILDDLIILRSSGYPTYNFSVVVDDALMGVTHVIRGDDHLNNTPRQIPIFKALGYDVPRFGHLSMIMGADKAKLSKRHGATSILAYKDMGYLPEAMINYLVRLGWSFGDQEIFSLPELIEKFDLAHVQKSSAVFNPDKLQWMNAHYIRHGEPKRLAGLLRPFFGQVGLGEAAEKVSDEWLEKLVVALRERARTLVEMATAAAPYVQDKIVVEAAAAEKFLTPEIAPLLANLTDRFERVTDFSKTVLEETFKKFLEDEGLKIGQLAQPVRVALTGRTASPGIFEVIDLLGRERILARLRQGIALAGRTRP